MRITTDISDLFFNTDMDLAATYDKNRMFTGYDQEQLHAIAEQWSETFERASGIHVNPADLVADFLARV